jgi:autotransporter-associated beta strand protein
LGDPNNWTPTTVPTSTGTATFTSTGTAAVDDSLGGFAVGTILFTSTPTNAQAYTFDIENGLVLNGSGITNNSTNTQVFNIGVIFGNLPQVVFNNSSSASGGTGAVTFNNSGFITFQNSSTAGSATIVNNENLTFTDSSNAGSAHITNNVETDFFSNASAATANITNSGFLTFNNSATAATSTITNSNNVQFNNASTAGTAGITNQNGGFITFSSTATGGGATFTNQAGGQITFNDSSTAGSAHINNTGNASLTFNNTSSAGSMVFTANPASNGTITFNNSGTAANAQIDLVDTTLIFNNTSNAGSAVITMSNVLHTSNITFNDTSSTGSADITNVSSLGINNTLRFLSASTAGSATINNNNGSGGVGGQLQFGTLGGTDTANAGTATINNNANGTTSFFAHTSAMNATITNNPAGNTNFQDESTAGNAVIVNNAVGTTNFGVPFVGTDTASAGNAHITNNGGGMTNFNAFTTAGNSTITTNAARDVFFFNSSTGGNARFITNFSGTFDMSGLTTAGMTAGSIEGAGSYVLGAKGLTVGSNDLSTTVSGVISGIGGSLVKVGTGTLALTGVNTYTGSTTVNGGTLEVDGSIAPSSIVTVNAGGTLSGTGTVGPAATTIMSGGTLAPGNAANPTGALAITGNLAFQSGAIYLVQVTPTSAASTNVSGTATLGGATVNAAFANGSYISKTYKILSATGGVSGTFGALTNTNLPANFSDTLGYDANNAYLNLKLGFVIPGGLNVNQQNVANALVNFFNTTGGIPMVYGTLTPAQLTQASGELATGSQQTTFDAMGLFMGRLTDPFMNRSGGAGAAPGATGYAEDGDSASAYAVSKRTDAFAMFTKAPPAAFQQRWSVWAAGFGGSQSTDGNAVTGSNNTTSNIYGTAVGADYLFSPNTVAGFALAGGGTNFSVNGVGSGHSDLFQAGAYIRHTEGGAYVSAALAYGWQDITTNRTVAIASVDQLRAEFNANAYSGRVEGGYRLVAPWTGGIGITPYAAGQFTTFDLPAYAESVLSGSSAFALGYGAKDVTDARSELGIRTDKSFIVQDGILTLRGRLAWAHDYDPDRSIAATFQSLPGASFVVNGAAQASDSALTTASVEMKWRNGWSAAATFEGEFSDVTTSYAGKGVVRYQW